MPRALETNLKERKESPLRRNEYVSRALHKDTKEVNKNLLGEKG